MSESKKSITTKTGDKGTTHLFSGEEVSKNSPRTDAYGDVDEIVSILGVAGAHAERDASIDAIRFLQRKLFIVATELATGTDHLEKLDKRIDKEELLAVERQMDALESQVVMPSGFILPGGTTAAAHLDHARTVARRCERKVVSLFEEKEVTNDHLLIWLNRLSDYLWLLARFEEREKTLEKD